MEKVQMRPKVKKEEKPKREFSLSKIHRLLARYIAILVMAGGLLGYIYEQADNNYVIMGVAVIAVYALVSAALSRDN